MRDGPDHKNGSRAPLGGGRRGRSSWPRPTDPVHREDAKRQGLLPSKELQGIAMNDSEYA